MRPMKPSASCWVGASKRCTLVAAGLALFAGCDLTGQNTNPANGSGPAQRPVVANTDPLNGSVLPPAGLTPVTQPSRAVAANPQVQTTTSGGVPALPAPTSTGGTATLASGAAPGNLNANGPDLRIGSGTSVTPGSTPGSAGQLPDPWQRSPASPGSSNVTLTGAAVGNSDAFQALQAELKKRNVAWQQLQCRTDGSGQWQFRCAFPDRQNASLQHVIDITAADPYQAIRQAIDQYDNPSDPASQPSAPKTS
jgi:hypothetical protein